MALESVWLLLFYQTTSRSFILTDVLRAVGCCRERMELAVDHRLIIQTRNNNDYDDDEFFMIFLWSSR